MKKLKGFTLIELMIVVSIIALISSVIIEAIAEHNEISNEEEKKEINSERTW